VNASLVVASDDGVDPAAAVTLQGTGVKIASTMPEVIYAVQSERSGDFLYFLNALGGIENSTPLSIPGLRALSVGLWNNRLYGAAPDNHGTRIICIDGGSGSLYSTPPFSIHGVGAICAFDRDTFYCGTDTGSIYRFTPPAKEVVLIGGRSGVGFSGFVRSGVDRLWAMASFPPVNDTLYSIDVNRGTALPVGTTGFKVRTNSLCRASDGRLLALVDNALAWVDTSTGRWFSRGIHPP
jgi:hypothetical protein